VQITGQFSAKRPSSVIAMPKHRSRPKQKSILKLTLIGVRG
jgi:hypothetical protein